MNSSATHFWLRLGKGHGLVEIFLKQTVLLTTCFKLQLVLSLPEADIVGTQMKYILRECVAEMFIFTIFVTFTDCYRPQNK